MAAVPKVYHWKHGWIPLDAYAKLEQSKRGSAAKLAENPIASRLAAPVRGLNDLSPALQTKINAKMSALTGMPEPKLAAKVQDNLVRLYGTGDKKALTWYADEGADIGRRAAALRAQYGIKLTQEQLTGMVAVTSAHKRWLENKDFAEAIARKLAEDKPFPVSQEMINDYNTFVGKRRNGLLKVHPELKPGTYKPSELPTDFAVSKTPGMPRHLNTDYVVNAARIYRNEATLDQVVGGPKQRSFVNNLMSPADPRSVTVDTWHYRAAMQGIPLTYDFGPKGQKKTYSYTLEQWADRELARNDGRAAMFGYDPSKPPTEKHNLKAIFKATKDPQDFFQSGPAAVADKYDGSYGTYPWFVKQTQAAASKLSVSPSSMQAVAWYSVGGGL
jgi:hypothetical protein